MNCAVYVNGRLAKSKKAVKEAVLADPSGGSIDLESTALFGDQYFGPLADLPKTVKANFVGPDPYRDRRFYGTIAWNASKERWIVT